jgi:hypothetical protein
VEAARFYTNPKLESVDLDSLCREPIETAYLNNAKPTLGGIAPCCHWIEEHFTSDIYSDHGAFERLWNSDTYRRLRRKRDFKSCNACGLARPFDEIGFHFTPLLKKNLVASRRCAEAEAEGDYADSELVRACRNLALDLRSLRRTVLRLGVPLQQLDSVKHSGLAVISEIDRACWDAFVAMDVPASDVDLVLGGCFPGIGWFEPDINPDANLAARFMGGGKQASAFVRVMAGYAYQLRVTAHHLCSAEMADWLHLTVCHEPVEAERSLAADGTAVLTAELPAELASRHDGRLRIGVIYNDLCGIDAWPSVSRIEAVRLDPSFC